MAVPQSGRDGVSDFLGPVLCASPCKSSPRRRLSSELQPRLVPDLGLPLPLTCCHPGPCPGGRQRLKRTLAPTWALSKPPLPPQSPISQSVHTDLLRTVTLTAGPWVLSRGDGGVRDARRWEVTPCVGQRRQDEAAVLVPGQGQAIGALAGEWGVGRREPGTWG